MFRRKLHRSGAEDSVNAGGEDGNLFSRHAIHGKIHQRAFAAADPVALHHPDFFRPMLQLLQIAQQLFGIIGDAQKPLFQLALLHAGFFVAPAVAATHHLLVSQYSGALRTPIHFALFAIGQPALVELQKEPLVPAVVLRQATGDFGGPIVGKAQPLHLRLHARDVAQRPILGRDIVLDSGIFRRQTESVPPHRMKHVVAAHPHVARQRIADGVVAHVSHMQIAGGVGKHLQHVIFFSL